jgi:hypothetical protein
VLQLDVQVLSHGGAELEAGLGHQNIAVFLAEYGQDVKEGTRTSKGQNYVVHVNWALISAKPMKRMLRIFRIVLTFGQLLFGLQGCRWSVYSCFAQL